MHVYGYPLHVLFEINIRELRKYIKNEPFFCNIIYLMVSKGKIEVKFRGDNDDFPNAFKIKLEELAFRLLNKKYQLRLLTIPSNLRIKICCSIKNLVDWDEFMQHFAFENGLSGSFWVHHETVSINGQHQMWFFIDAIDYYLIERKGRVLLYKGDQIEAKVAENPFGHDMNNLP